MPLDLSRPAVPFPCVQGTAELFHKLDGCAIAGAIFRSVSIA